MSKRDSSSIHSTQGSQAEKSRRRLLKAAVAGGGVAAGLKSLPKEWGKPVVDSVVLPGHAQVSEGLFDPCSSEIDPISVTSWNVRVTGTVGGGTDGSNITVNATGSHGTVTRNGSDTTNTNGEYEIVLGLFTCADGGAGQVNVTVMSPDPRLQGQQASCPANTQKCAAPGP